MRRVLASILVFFCSAPAFAQVSIPAEMKVKAGRLFKLSATSKTTVRWLNLNADLDLLPDSSGAYAICLAAKPGVYKVAAFSCDKDGSSDPVYCVITAEGDAPPPAPQPPPQGKANPAAATCKLRFGSSGCTATIIQRREKDDPWQALTASHCTGKVGSHGTIILQDGRNFPVTVVSRNTDADISWLKIEASPTENFPFAVLATSAPAVGTAVWHQGYGVDRPGNRETGTVTGGIDGNGQLQFQLSVSSGDSGSGIFREDNGELVGCVCCTQSRGRKVTMWGGSSLNAIKLRVADERVYPILILPDPHYTIPVEIPIRPRMPFAGTDPLLGVCFPDGER